MCQLWPEQLQHIQRCKIRSLGIHFDACWQILSWRVQDEKKKSESFTPQNQCLTCLFFRFSLWTEVIETAEIQVCRWPEQKQQEPIRSVLKIKKMYLFLISWLRESNNLIQKREGGRVPCKFEQSINISFSKTTISCFPRRLKWSVSLRESRPGHVSSFTLEERGESWRRPNCSKLRWDELKISA